MDVIWSSAANPSVQDVIDALGPDHNYKTVMTVLNRLVEKQMLDRQLDGRAYRYSARLERGEFLQSAAGGLVRGYLDMFGADAAAHLAKAASAAMPQPPVQQHPVPPPTYHIYQPPPPRQFSMVTVALAAIAIPAIAYLLGRRRAR